MRAVAWIVRQRLSRRWRTWVGVGVVLGVGFGLAFAAFNTARRTGSAYDRVLAAADAPDASLFHFLSPAEAQTASADLPGVRARRHLVGFFGEVPGIDPSLTRALVAGSGARFPFEAPTVREGRLPARDRADEAFVNQFLADRAGLRVGDRLDLRLFAPPEFTDTTRAPVTIVGIGPLPRDVVIDDTAGAGVTVFSEAFAERYAAFQEYGATYVDLAPGVDPRRDLAPAVGALGFQLQEIRTQGEHAVEAALRPMLIMFVGVGALAFLATALAAAQILQRNRERTRTDDEQLQRLGMTRRHVVVAFLAPVGVTVAVTVVIAAAVMAALSPLAPAGPLHRLDPGQGIAVDWLVLTLGVTAVAVTLLGTATLLAVRRRPDDGDSTRRRLPRWVAQLPLAQAGLALTLGNGGRRRRFRRSAAFATGTVVLTVGVVTLVGAAVELSATPPRYGFDWDLIAVTQQGDLAPRTLDRELADHPTVSAASGFTGWSLLLDGRAVPALATTPIKGELGPTLLRGRSLRADDEVLVGQETLEQLDLDLGDRVQIAAPQADGSAAPAPAPFRVVGVAIFPPVNQIGSDSSRLGTGALVTRTALDQLIGTDTNDPDWTAVRLAADASTRSVISRFPDGIPNRTGEPTTWYTDAKPAELRQLDEIRGLLDGAIVMSAVIALGVIVYDLVTQTKANRRDLAMLGALGFTRRQRGRAAAWQAAPIALVVVLLGIPLGLVLGRLAFATFAQSLAVDDRAALRPATIAGLVGATLAAVAIGAMVAAWIARTSPLVRSLRAE